MRALRLTADSLLLMITIATQSISAKISPKDQATLDAQVSSGRQVKYGSQVIDLLSPSLLQAASGAPSSWAAVSPRWIVADERLTMPNAPASIDSGKIIKSFTKGPGWIDAVPAAPGQTSVTMHREYTRLFSDELLFACWVLDPDSYAFYFVAGLSIVVVPPVSAPIYEEGPPTNKRHLSRIPIERSPGGSAHDGRRLPDNAHRRDLRMLFARSGFQLLITTRAAQRLARAFYMDSLSAAPVMTPGGPTWGPDVCPCRIHHALCANAHAT